MKMTKGCQIICFLFLLSPALASNASDSPTLKELTLFPDDYRGQSLTLHGTRILDIERSGVKAGDTELYYISVFSQDGTRSRSLYLPFYVPENIAKELVRIPGASTGKVKAHITFKILPVSTQEYDPERPLAHVLAPLMSDDFGALINTIRLVDENGSELQHVSNVP